MGKDAIKKIDFKKDFKHLYKPSAKEVGVVKVPAMNFLMIDGEGDPNTAQSFQDAIETLFSVSYTLKFKIKKGDVGIDYGVLPLEGLWWTDDMSKFSIENKDIWKWTLMIMQPEYINIDLVEIATAEVKKKKNLVAIDLVRFEEYSEGESAQIMHLGPFSEEGPTIAKLHEYIDTKGKKKSGKHHEIYLSDIRRAAPEKWKTIIRQAFV